MNKLFSVKINYLTIKLNKPLYCIKSELKPKLIKINDCKDIHNFTAYHNKNYKNYVINFTIFWNIYKISLYL